MRELIKCEAKETIAEQFRPVVVACIHSSFCYRLFSYRANWDEVHRSTAGWEAESIKISQSTWEQSHMMTRYN